MAKSASKSKLPVSWIKIDNRVSALVALLVVGAGYATYSATQASREPGVRFADCRVSGVAPEGSVGVGAYDNSGRQLGYESVDGNGRSDKFDFVINGLSSSVNITVYAKKSAGEMQQLGASVVGPCG